jgi:peroxiredoxin
VNCIRNYPWYKDWHETFSEKDFTVIGVHTPELSHEEGTGNVATNAKEKGLKFPIVVDDEKQHWNAWGNSMWPSVYLIDKQGYARYWWYGELNWQGSGGQEIFKQRIAELIAESG